MRAGLETVRGQLHALLAGLPGDGVPDTSQAAALERLLGNLQVLTGWLPGQVADNDPVWKLLKVVRALLVCTEPGTRCRLLAFCLRHSTDNCALVSQVVAALAFQVHQTDANNQTGGEPGRAKLHCIRNGLAFFRATNLYLNPLPETEKYVRDNDPLDQLRFYPDSLAAESFSNKISHARQTLLQSLAEKLAASQWTLSAWCSSGGTDVCRQLVGLAELGNNPVEAAHLRNLQSRLVSLHCRQVVPDRQMLDQLLGEMIALEYANSAIREVRAFAEPVSNHPARIQPDSELVAALQLELASYTEALEIFLDSRAACKDEEKLRRHALLLLTGRMQWVLHAAGLAKSGDCFTCCHEVMARYWFCRMPWPRRLVTLLEQLGSLTRGKQFQDQDDACWETLQIRLLGPWPRDIQSPDTSIRLGEVGTTTLGQLPALLSQSLDILVAADKDGFSDLPFPAARTGELMKALAFLERGAAGVQVKPVEILCGQLLEIYGLLQVGDITLPAALLGKCHRSLVQMLDAAACWCEPAEDPALHREICQWLEENRARHAGNPSPEDWAGMSSALQAFAGRLGTMLAIPLRLEIPPVQQVARQFPFDAALQAVQALLPHLLLGISAATDCRKSRYQPAITVFTLKTGRHADMPMLILSDDSTTAIPAAAELARLARRLPGKTGLSCSLKNDVRNFTITLPESNGPCATDMTMGGITS